MYKIAIILATFMLQACGGGDPTAVAPSAATSTADTPAPSSEPHMSETEEPSAS